MLRQSQLMTLRLTKGDIRHLWSYRLHPVASSSLVLVILSVQFSTSPCSGSEDQRAPGRPSTSIFFLFDESTILILLQASEFGGIVGLVWRRVFCRTEDHSMYDGGYGEQSKAERASVSYSL